jgi:hypothetical protein
MLLGCVSFRTRGHWTGHQGQPPPAAAVSCFVSRTLPTRNGRAVRCSRARVCATDANAVAVGRLACDIVDWPGQPSGFACQYQLDDLGRLGW